MHPILFTLPTPWGPQPVYAYGVMLGVSLFLGWQLVMSLGKRAELAPQLLGDVYLTAAISGIVGARLLYIVTNSSEFDSPLQWLDIRGGGLVAYGGFVGGFIGALVHLRLKCASLLAFGDCAAPGIALGLFFTRIGCYLYGCDFGVRLSPSAPGWLQRLGSFPHWPDMPNQLRGSPAFMHHVDAYGLSRDAAFSFPVHPTQLYEALFGLALTTMCLRLWLTRKFPGQVMLALTMAYSLCRFVLEFLRDDPERGSALGFSTSQLISLVLFPAAVFTYGVMSRRARDAGFSQKATI